ncbi:alkaline phosphatase PhoX, partial [uncultured Methylobacterium sp.]
MAIGPSTTQTPYLVPSTGNVSFTSLLSVGDTVPGSVKADGTPWRFVGIPDGIGAFDNGDGTATVLVNHEIGATSGVVRAHGSAGAFVDRLVVDKASLKVLSAGDLGTSYYGFDAATGAYVQGTTALARLCSADLPAVSAFYDASTGLGTKARIFMNGEETGAEGRALAWVVNGPEAGRIYELPRLGKFSMENSLANPATGVKTVTIGTDDSATGQLYVYVGTKQATGSEIDKAGLTNGKLYGIKVPSVLVETNATSVAAAGAAFSLQEMGPNGDVSRMTGAQLQAESDAEGVTTFLRPEDGAWDPSNPNRFYFNTTNAITSPSRLWALEFTDVTRPELGGTVKEVLRGTEGQVMLDNMTVTADGKVILQEDPGNNARISKIFQYDPANGSLTELAQHDPARFGTPPTAPFNQDEESSGIVDVSTIFGGPGRQAFLLDTQAHYTLGGELVEGGQLMLMTQDRSIRGTDGNDTLTGSAIDDLIDGRAGTDTLVFGSRLADATVTRDG